MSTQLSRDPSCCASEFDHEHSQVSLMSRDLSCCASEFDHEYSQVSVSDEELWEKKEFLDEFGKLLDIVSFDDLENFDLYLSSQGSGCSSPSSVSPVEDPSIENDLLKLLHTCSLRTVGEKFLQMVVF